MSAAKDTTRRTPPNKAAAAYFLVALAALITACGGGGKPAEESRYDLKGKVVAVDRVKGSVTVDHEDIPNFMPAMQMAFTLRDAEALKVVDGGDRIQATLVVTNDGYWLESPIITKGLPGGDGAPTPAAASEPQPGAEVPDAALVNQDKKPLSIRQLRGSALLVTFIYTRCPFPDQCPLMSANLAEVRRGLEGEPEVRKRLRLLSVTLDPEFDTPEVLRKHGEPYAGARFDGWDFATGDAGEIRKLAQFFGLTYKAENGQVTHSLRTAVVTPEGKLHKLYRGNEWKPAEVTRDLKTLLSSP